MTDFLSYLTEEPSVNYWLILLHYSQDDPLTLASLLDTLEESMRHQGVKMPDSLSDEIASLRSDLRKTLQDMIQSKKQQLASYRLSLQKKLESESHSDEEPKKLSRTQEIFGTQG